MTRLTIPGEAVEQADAAVLLDVVLPDRARLEQIDVNVTTDTFRFIPGPARTFTQRTATLTITVPIDGETQNALHALTTKENA